MDSAVSTRALDPARPSAGIAPLRFVWLDRLEDVEKLEAQWRKLQARVRERMAFGSYDYIVPWYREHRGAQGAILVGTAWRGDELVGIAPLAARRATLSKVPVRRIDSACHEGDIGEFLIPDDEIEAFEGILDSLIRRGGADAIVLKGLSPGSPRLKAVERVAAKHGRRFALEPYYYAVVELNEGYAAYERGLGRKLRGNLRRRARKMKEMGGGALDRLRSPADPDVVGAYLKRMFAVANKSWKERSGRATEERHHRFFSDVAQRANLRGMLDLSILVVGGRDAAFVFGLQADGVYYDVMISFDHEFASISPGSLLIQELLRRLPADGIRRLVSHGDYEYKRYWASAFVPQTRAIIFCPGVRAALAYAVRYRVPELLNRFRKPAPAGALPRH